MRKEIVELLKDGPEQRLVVGPIVERLIGLGWEQKQIIFGKNEWKIPITHSEASKREKNEAFDYFPVDVAVFDSVETTGDYRHLLFIIECKQPDIDVGLQQLETYLGLEPHVKLGIWANNADISAKTLFVYKDNIGADTVSIAFQVLRSAALKQEEGQYFTPKQVIQAAIKLMDLSLDDMIIDPACGTGGYGIFSVLSSLGSVAKGGA